MNPKKTRPIHIMIKHLKTERIGNLRAAAGKA